MSINVTVNGNPIKIKRGTMVTAESDSKGEMEKRRKIRLAQVRRQSDEIAAKVRKRVQNEREKEETNYEQKEENNLQAWKLNRLLELQAQYCDSLKNLGLAHAQAVIEEARDQVDREYKDALIEKSKQRGNRAARKLHKEQENKEKQIPKELQENRKTCLKESKRSINKSPFRKKKKRKKCDLNDDNENDNFEIDCVQGDSREEDNGNANNDEKKGQEKFNIFENENIDIVVENNKVSPSLKDYLDKGTTHRSKSPKSFKSTRSKSPKSNLRSPSPPKLADIIIHHPPDTRISDRIKNRRLPLYRDSILGETIIERGVSAKDIPVKLMVSTGTLTEAEKEYVCCCKCKCKSSVSKPCQEEKVDEETKKSTSRNIGTITENDLLPLKIQTTRCDCCTCNNNEDVKKSVKNSSPSKRRINSSEIPSKPTIVLKGAHKSKSDLDKVQFYDHENRFGKEYEPPENHVQRIFDSDIEVISQIDFDSKFKSEIIYKHDKEAQVRGKKALEKEKIQKDYNELMQKLPALQRQERMASLAAKNANNNPAFHMSNDRLKQQELKKQCKMEDAYEKIFPHTVTLKPKTRVDDEPFRVNDTVEPPPYHWDVNCQENGVVLTKDDGIITINPNVSDQTDNLKIMLDKLKKQKEMLMKEVETLPRDSNLDSIIEDLERFRYKEDKQSGSEKNYGDSELIDIKKHHQKKSPRRVRSKTSHSNKYKKSHKVVHKVLQNTSTQTSPKITTEKTFLDSKSTNVNKFGDELEVSKTESKKKLKEPLKVSKEHKLKSKSSLSNKSLSASKLIQTEENIKHHDKCKCCPCDKNSDVCEIVIKIQDDVPQINIKSPNKTKIDTQASLITSDEVILKQNENISRKKLSEIDSNLKEKKLTKLVLPVEKTVPKLSWSKTLTLPGDPSSSTSYYSPPDFQKPDTSNDITSERKEVLLKYIKKLLTMSRKSVENLHTSDGSSMESSLSSVSNPSAASLAIKLLQASLQNMEKQLNTTSTSSSSIKTNDYDASISNNNIKHDVAYENNKLVVAAEKYQSMADQCHKRISNLTAMIEKVRKEKEQILSPNFSDKESSTGYLNLPNLTGENSNNKSPSLVSDTESEEQKLLNKLLLDVNMNLDKINEQPVRFKPQLGNNSPDKDFIDPDFYQRFQNLMNIEESDENVIRDMINESIHKNLLEKNEEFVPMINIPRLPKLKPHLTTADIDQQFCNKPRKPPPAKGLSAAKKFNGEITNIPHELSTIPEVDSQLSTKISPQKPVISKQVKFKQKNSNSSIEIDQMPIVILPSTHNSCHTNPEEQHISQESMPDIVIEVKSSESSSSIISDEREKQQNDRSNSSDMENLETMLASMGMGWAIATLRKTQNAFVQNGSSTSSEDQRKYSKEVDSSTSDVTLRDFMGKKIFSTSSTLGSTSQSISPFVRELEDISLIHGPAMNQEYKRARTSTPIGVINISGCGQQEKILIAHGNSSKDGGGFVTLPEESQDKSEKSE